MHSKIPKIAKLGKDMLSFDSEFVSIDAPYFFEASELNYIDGYITIHTALTGRITRPAGRSTRGSTFRPRAAWRI
ncbi:MAG: hypothetical protein ACLTZI_08165 [[Eubacterium] siraeum]